MPSSGKPRQMRRCNVVALHEGVWSRVRGAPGTYSEIRAAACHSANGIGMSLGRAPTVRAMVPQKLLVRIDLRAAEFIARTSQARRAQQCPRYSLCDILHIDRL